MSEARIAQGTRNQYALLVDPNTGREFNLTRHTTSIGRSISCDVVLTDKSVSRQHAVVYCMSGKFFLEDIGSTNGTCINGKLIGSRVPLDPGDQIMVGVCELVFLLIPDRNAKDYVYVEPEPTIINQR